MLDSIKAALAGTLGGKVRAEKLSPARRSEIAKLAAAKRWAAKHRHPDMPKPEPAPHDG